MPSSEGFKDFVLEQLKSCESGFSFSERKMFGEYCIYLHNGILPPRAAFLLCDDRLFVKKYDELLELCKECELGFAYEGAKEGYVLDVENMELLREVVMILDRILPPPKEKSKRKRK